METEAQQLRHVLDSLSEGYLTTSASLSRSPLLTGNALVSANRLERQLWMRFGRLRETAQLIGRHWRVTAEAVRQSRLLLDSDSLNQQLPLARETLARATDELTSNQAVLQDLWGLSNAYMQSAGSEGLTGAKEPRSSGPFPFGSGT
jgi:hypothetical protein